ncbi:hypothetical protein ACHAWU_002360 [Discostella pseudostelligera]|uniref:Tyrosyl-DNA phosphodiesterase 1 n=1 Tax=Discostella pseudostelligera TaxID=259834 RepID=A0ABD3M6X3_9STRA
MTPKKRVVLPPGEIPYVSPNGGTTRYYADRYYLDAPTALPEYQSLTNDLDSGENAMEDCSRGNNGRHRRSKNSSDVSHCNKCGEKTRNEDGSSNSNNSSHHWPPLFDRAKFINSLDLSAVIIGTYSIGDLDYLSEEFPRLFPPQNSRTNRNHNYVPTLVLHGQRGFHFESWSSSRKRGRSSVGTANEGGKTTVAKSEINDPMELRGGGGGKCSSSSDPSTMHDTRISEQVPKYNGVEVKQNPSPSSTKTQLPCFTFGGQQLNLPRTPKRLRRSSTKKQPQKYNAANTDCMTPMATEKNQPSSTDNDTTNNCRVSIANADTERNESKLEVIEIDSDSDADKNDDGDVDDLAKPTVYASAAKAIPRGTPRSKDACISSRIADNTRSHDGSGMTPPKKDVTTMQSILHDNAAPDGCLEESCTLSSDAFPNISSLDHDNPDVTRGRDNQPTMGWGGVKPTTAFGGEVFFTQILPRWRPPQTSNGEGKRKSSKAGVPNNSRPTTAEPTPAQYSDDPKEFSSTKTEEKDPKITTTAGGVHHPKFFLLFESSGSLVVIVSTSNLSPQRSLEGSWVQRFEPNEINKVGSGGSGVGDGSKTNGYIDYGMPSDFGAILTDFLTKQSDAAASGGMLPDVFLRRYVPGLSSGLNVLAEKYRFTDAQVHLVSTVPGDYVSGIPKNAHRDPSATYYKPRLSYGPQRVSYILSRILDSGHIRSARVARAASAGRVGGNRMEADTSWLPPTLVGANDRLVMQPTSLGGNWTRGDLEEVMQSYLRPHWELPRHNANDDGGTPMEDDFGPLNVMDIVWPSMECIDALSKRRRSILEKRQPELAAASSTKQCSADEDENSEEEGGEAPHFLSSISFAKLDRSCISRLSLFTHVPNNGMPYTSTSIHFKSICRLLRLTDTTEEANKSVMLSSNNQQPSGNDVLSSKEYLSWFMLTSACLSRGAQGRPTPHSDPASDSMSYMNFELGILFCSRLMGDNVHDRIYVSDPTHTIGCQCGKGSRWYKSRFLRTNGGGGGEEANGFLECVRKVHLPVPYQLRPMPYRTDPDSDLMDYTPFMHDIPPGSECVGNMKLTPFGRRKMELNTL